MENEMLIQKLKGAIIYNGQIKQQQQQQMKCCNITATIKRRIKQTAEIFLFYVCALDFGYEEKVN